MKTPDFPTLLLIVAGCATASTSYARPPFQVPLSCGVTWDTYTHSGHSDYDKVDLANPYGATQGAPVLSSAAGTVVESYWDGCAGNLVAVDHGGGWTTRFMHLDARYVSTGQVVSQGQQLGTVGNTGTCTSGAHLHYEQKYYSSVEQAMFDGVLLPRSWYQQGHYKVTSNNCGGSNPAPQDDGKYWVDTYANASGHASPGGPVTGTLYAGTSYVYCKKWGPKEEAGGHYNHWWLKTDLDEGPAGQWVSALMLSHWGNDEARDNDGRDLPECDYLPYGAIGDAYYAMGGIDSPLGLPIQAEADAQLGGRYQRFENGIMLWHADTGAYPVYGQILEHFEQTGAEGTWGFPVTEERDAADSPATGAAGRYQYFQNGLFLWTPQTGAHVVHGAFHDHFANNGREEVFGYPETDEVPHGNGVKQTFEKAIFYWDPANWVQVQWR